MISKAFRVIFAVAVLIGMFLAHSEARGKSRARVFTGKIIYIGDRGIELKSRLKEVSLVLPDPVKVLNIKGKIADVSALRLCQTVKAYYVVSRGKNVLQKIRILKNSTCVKAKAYIVPENDDGEKSDDEKSDDAADDKDDAKDGPSDAKKSGKVKGDE